MNTRVALIAAVVATAAVGCHKKPPANAKTDNTPVAAATATPDANAGGEEARAGLPDVKTQTLATVFFAFDSSTLDDAGKTALQQDFDILKANPEVRVRLEGNTDERGSTQYNVALGQRRAESVKNFLVSLGIPEASLETVSYGEEKPADAGHDEAAWEKNRRVDLTVTAGTDKVSSSR